MTDAIRDLFGSLYRFVRSRKGLSRRRVIRRYTETDDRRIGITDRRHRAGWDEGRRLTDE